MSRYAFSHSDAQKQQKENCGEFGEDFTVA